MIYKASKLDIRNIGATIGVQQGTRRVFGEVASISRHDDGVEIYLTDNSDPLQLAMQDEVDVQLPIVGNYTKYGKDALESIQDLLEDVIDRFPSQGAPVAAVAA